MIHYPDKFGESYSDLYLLGDGIILLYDHIRTKNLSSVISDVADKMILPGNMMIVNICNEGRCEIMPDDGKMFSLARKRVAISRHLPTSDFKYPDSYFDGLELFIDLDKVELSDKRLIDAAEIDFPWLVTHLNIDKRTYLQYTNILIDKMCNRLWKIRNTDKIGEMRIITAIIIKEFHDFPVKSLVSTFLTKQQIKLVKDFEEIMCKDLSQRYTIAKVAEILNINQSTLKKYFKEVQGVNPTRFMAEKRITHAKELLTTTDLRVSDIAALCGYGNAGKFSIVFRNHCGQNPSEYRLYERIKKLNIQRGYPIY